MKRIAIIGECLIELNGTPFGALRQTFGGDSLNTALYLSRLTGHNTEVKYVSVLGTDSLSDGLIERWTAEGLDTQLVLRDPSRLPGMYLIEIDTRGERTFLYWRGESAARYLLQHPEFDHVLDQLSSMNVIFVTGISLAILSLQDRTNLIASLTRLAASGVSITFDTNYRSRLWASSPEAQAAMRAVAAIATIVFATFDDEQQLWGDATPHDTLSRMHRAGARLIVLKLGAEGCLISDGMSVTQVPSRAVANVVDTTAAGDAFNAAFLAGWVTGHDHLACSNAGNALAGIVIQHRGAIIPASAMPSLSELFEN